MDCRKETIKDKIIAEWQALFGIKDLKFNLRYLDKQIREFNKKTDSAYEKFEDDAMSKETFKRLEENYLSVVHKYEKQKENLIRMHKNSNILKNKAEEIIDDLIELREIDNSMLRCLIRGIKIWQNGNIEINWNFNK